MALKLQLQLPEKPHLFPTPLHLPSITTTFATKEVESLSDLEKIQELGKGSGGTVYKVRHKRTQLVYALKVIRDDASAESHHRVLRELDIMIRCANKNSPFIVGCRGVFQKPSGDVCILMEHMDGGSLDTLVKKFTTTSFSEDIIANIAYQALMGLNHLHTNLIVHRDIKPGNLLVNQKMEVKIADFGVSKILRNMDDTCNNYVGTCAYMSPEGLDADTYGKNNGFAGDVWSLGLTLMELYMGHHPYSQPGQQQLGSDQLELMICFEEPPSLPEDASEDFRDFINCCLQKESSKRWTVSQLLSHPFVRNGGHM